MLNTPPPTSKEEAEKLMADAVAKLSPEDAKFSRSAWDILRAMPYEDGYAMFVLSADEATRDGFEQGYAAGAAAGLSIAAQDVIEAARDWADGRTADDCRPGSEVMLHNAVMNLDCPEPPA